MVPGMTSDKATLRDRLKAVRANEQPRMRQFAALEVASLGCRLLNGRPGLTIAGYMPIGSEIDPRILMQDLERRGHQLALPVVTAPDEALVFKRYAIGDDLLTGAYGIQTPVTDAPDVVPDILLVPGLGFDSRLYRLGYGGGYYDRTITNLVASGVRLETIGLAFASQMVDTLPIDDHDVPMTMVLTEAGMHVHRLG